MSLRSEQLEKTVENLGRNTESVRGTAQRQDSHDLDLRTAGDEGRKRKSAASLRLHRRAQRQKAAASLLHRNVWAASSARRPLSVPWLICRHVPFCRHSHNTRINPQLEELLKVMLARLDSAAAADAAPAGAADATAAEVTEAVVLARLMELLKVSDRDEAFTVRE